MCRKELSRGIVYFTPEMLLVSKRWREMLLEEVYMHSLRTLLLMNIGLKNELVISKSPSKSNIMYTPAKYSSIEETFLPIAKRLHKDRSRCPCMIVYCKSFADCADLYEFFRDYLGLNFTEPTVVKKPVTGRSTEKNMCNYRDNKSSCRTVSFLKILILIHGHLMNLCVCVVMCVESHVRVQNGAPITNHQ